jgi:hypothetical protein
VGSEGRQRPPVPVAGGVGLWPMRRSRTAERSTPLRMRWHSRTVAGARRWPRSVVQACTAECSIFASEVVAQRDQTWFRMIEASRRLPAVLAARAWAAPRLLAATLPAQ